MIIFAAFLLYFVPSALLVIRASTAHRWELLPSSLGPISFACNLGRTDAVRARGRTNEEAILVLLDVACVCECVVCCLALAASHGMPFSAHVGPVWAHVGAMLAHVEFRALLRLENLSVQILFKAMTCPHNCCACSFGVFLAFG